MLNYNYNSNRKKKNASAHIFLILMLNESDDVAISIKKMLTNKRLKPLRLSFFVSSSKSHA